MRKSPTPWQDTMSRSLTGLHDDVRYNTEDQHDAHEVCLRVGQVQGGLAQALSNAALLRAASLHSLQ